MPLFANAKRRELFISIVPAIVATLVTNGLIFALGVEGTGTKALSWAPPGWFIGSVWVVLYVFYGLSRYTLVQAGSLGKKRAWLVVALMVWGILYPLTSGGFDPFWSAVQNLTSVCFTIAVMILVWPVSQRAGMWLIPSLVWELFANVLGLAALRAVQGS